jgi:hypothetical protein
MARAAADGHSFAFDVLDHRGNPRGDQRGGGCERPCADMEDKVCGCTDAACTGPILPGEEHNRRWAVYEVITSRK